MGLGHRRTGGDEHYEQCGRADGKPIKKLPQATLKALRLAACIGSRFDLSTLELISNDKGSDAYEHMLPAIEAGLVVPDRDLSSRQGLPGAATERTRLRFLHDRVQQAAYAMLNEDTKQEVHLQIGLQLKTSVPNPAKSERLFEIVDHLNVGGHLLLEEAAKQELATLNLQAARRAVFATAYGAGCDYAVAGLSFLASDSWQTDYELTRDLHRVQVDAEYLRGDLRPRNG